ncbi:MAG: ABC transporter ATP-binding protein [Deltaproteobacteria bacterium]|nr:ABC transporter ATP-binding protein [Deltaproteobacteria bacterium]
MVALELRGIAKSFGAVQVLDSIDLSVAHGELVALLGPSGCGKSTLIRIIAGLDRPDRGSIKLGEHVVSDDRTHVPPEDRRLGMVFQSYAVWPHRTVAENVAYPLRIQRRPKAEIAREVARALELVRLTGLDGRYPHELSGGQQQRVALARALAAEPQILLLDEPLSNLDARLREEMRREIRDLGRRLSITVVLVTHDQAEALSTADRVAVMRSGRIVQLASPEEIYRRPADLYVARVVGAVNALEVASVRAAGPKLEVEAGPVRAVLEGAAPAAPLGSLRLMVRPENVRLDDHGELRFTVESLAFLGDRAELELSREGARLRAVSTALHAPRVGDEVGVRLDDPLLLETDE